MLVNELDALIRKPNAKLESLFWDLMKTFRIAKRRQESRIIEKVEHKEVLGQKLVSVPNAISVLRGLLLGPFFFVAVIYHTPRAIPIAIHIAAALSDWLDGVLARYYGTTRLGGIIDASSDKVYMAWCLGAIYGSVSHPAFWTLIAVETLLFMVPLFAVRQMRLGKLPTGTNTDSIGFGKYKFASECAVPILVIFGDSSSANILIWMATVLAIASAVGKVAQIWPTIRNAFDR